MRTDVSERELVAAAERVATTFETIPARPVVLGDVTSLGPDDETEIRRRYRDQGFCIVELADVAATPETLSDLGVAMRLGEPFIAPLYRLGSAKPDPVARISAGGNAGTALAVHPSFGRTVGQNLHTDGTLQEIGYLKAAILLCQQPALEGGETMLFNTTAAFAELMALDPDAGVTLTTPGTLVRKANINGSTDENRGPVVAVIDGELVGRYSTTATDSVAVPDGVDEEALRRGMEFLAEAARPGGRHYVELTLSAGQAIVFDNTRISHGRMAYLDAPDQPRCIYRMLFLRHPCGSAPRPAT